MSREEYIKSRLVRAKEFRTNIIIGEAVNIFKKIYQGDYYTLNTEKEVKSFLSEWSTPYDKPLVIEDLSLMSPQVQKYFLKFIEEPMSPIILLASEDNISPIILSRCMNIVKIENDITQIELPLKEYIKHNKYDGDNKYICPEYDYYFNSSKIVQDYTEEFKDACIMNFQYGEYSVTSDE